MDPRTFLDPMEALDKAREEPGGMKPGLSRRQMCKRTKGFVLYLCDRHLGQELQWLIEQFSLVATLFLEAVTCQERNTMHTKPALGQADSPLPRNTQENMDTPCLFSYALANSLTRHEHQATEQQPILLEKL
jgi:hypothetical protein